MPDAPAIGEALLDILASDGSRRSVRVTAFPFSIGRGGGIGNHLQLPDGRISRRCAEILSENRRFYLEDRGQRGGIFVNGNRIDRSL
jgi:pSer/pThr/pTyr-binding forkhead associated (FHA) protein